MSDVYAGVGRHLKHYELNADSATLTERGVFTLPSRVQYAWPHGALPVLYVACADRSDVGAQNCVLVALWRGDDGWLSTHGPHVELPARPVHTSVDPRNGRIVVAYPQAPGFEVYEVRDDGRIGALVTQPAPPPVGVYPHQARVSRNGQSVTVIGRGHPADDGDPYVAGSITGFRYRGGVVHDPVRFDLTGSVEFPEYNPRHLDFHPRHDLAYVCVGAQNALAVHALDSLGRLRAEPVWVRSILDAPHELVPTQSGQAIHVHPHGIAAYVAKKATASEEYGGVKEGPSWETSGQPPVLGGGENGIAVFTLDAETGEPALTQSVESGGVAPRTFAIDPTATVLIAGNRRSMFTREGESVVYRPSSLAVFRISRGGLLQHLSTVDVGAGAETMTWMGVVGR